MKTQKRTNSSSIQLASFSSGTSSGTDFRVLMERLSEGWWHGEGETDRCISAPLTSHLLRPKPSCHAKTQNFARQWSSALLIECLFLRREILLSSEKCYTKLRLEPLSSAYYYTEYPFYQWLFRLRILVNNIDRNIGYWWGNRRERDNWGDLGVDGWITLGRISRTWDVGIWTALGWRRIETGGRRLWVR